MEKELKGAIIEVILLTIFLIITIPICVKASSDYKEEKEKYLNVFNTTIDVNNNGDYKELSIYSNTDNEITIRLGLTTNKFYDEYYIELDGKTYNLKDLEYQEDENNRYYIIGTYKINELKKVNFQMKPVKQSYFKEHLIYSFYATTAIN